MPGKIVKSKTSSTSASPSKAPALTKATKLAIVGKKKTSANSKAPKEKKERIPRKKVNNVIALQTQDGISLKIYYKHLLAQHLNADLPERDIEAENRLKAEKKAEIFKLIPALEKLTDSMNDSDEKMNKKDKAVLHEKIDKLKQQYKDELNEINTKYRKLNEQLPYNAALGKLNINIGSKTANVLDDMVQEFLTGLTEHLTSYLQKGGLKTIKPKQLATLLRTYPMPLANKLIEEGNRAEQAYTNKQS